MLSWAEYWYNTAYQTSAGMTPFQALYGRMPPTIPQYIRGSTNNLVVEQYMLNRDEVLALLKRNLAKAHSRMKDITDRKRQDTHFAEGDWVYVKLKPYRQSSVRLQHHHKLGLRYFGSFQVIKRVGEVAYKLALPEAARIHLVFHISMLKKCVGNPT